MTTYVFAVLLIAGFALSFLAGATFAARNHARYMAKAWREIGRVAVVRVPRIEDLSAAFRSDWNLLRSPKNWQG